MGFRIKDLFGSLVWELCLFAVLAAPCPAAAEPVPVPAAGTYSGPVSVTFEIPPGVTLHYTTDGSEPSTRSRVYSAPLVLEKDTVLRYFWKEPGEVRGVVREAFYRVGTAQSSADDLAASADPPSGEYLRWVAVTLRGKPGATIYYTVDGTEPDTDSTIYSSPLMISNDTILKFFALGATGKRGPVQKENYSFRLTDRKVDTTAPQVQAVPLPDGFRAGDLIELRPSEEAVVYYTLDGTDPGPQSSLYTSPIALRENAKLRFRAVDMAGNSSPITSLQYVVDTEAPSSQAVPPSGLYVPPVTVHLSASEEGAVIHYTLDGSEPGAESPVYRDALILRQDTTLRFFASDRFGNREAEHREEYAFDDKAPVTVAQPMGGTFKPPIVVSLSTEDGARIHYSVDGKDPDMDSPIYAQSITFQEPATLKFFAVDRLGNREKTQTQQYALVSGVWRRFARGVFLIPSVTDGRTFYMGTESGLAIYRVGSGTRQFLGEAEGLLGREIRDMVLDEGGDLWVATERGLNRYREGRGFTHFRREEGLPDGETLSIAVDLDNSVWVGTPKGAARISRDAVVQILTDRDGLADNRVLCIMVDPAGNKWFGTRKGLSKFTGREWDTFNRATGLIDDEVDTVAMDTRWNVWCGTPSGISVFDRRKWRNYGEADGLPSESVTLIAPDRDGEVWVATRAGVVRYAGGKWIREETP